VLTYFIRRLFYMIPTLFGVTVVAFLIMKLAPGNPVDAQMGVGGTTGASGQTSESIAVMRRDLKLDKPILLNFNFFSDFSEPAQIAARYRGMTAEEIAAELPQLVAHRDEPESAARLQFLASLDITKFEKRIENPEEYNGLADAIGKGGGGVQRWCEDMGEYAVPAMMRIMEDSKDDLPLRRGAIRSLASMVAEPFLYTYPQEPTEAQSQTVEATWRTWWQRNKAKFEPLDEETVTQLKKSLTDVAALPSRREIFEQLEYFSPEQAPFFIDVLLGKSPLKEKEIAAMALRMHVGTPLSVDVALDAPREQVDQVVENWQAYYTAHGAEYHPNFLQRAWYIVADTQYAHMVARLVTFQFGRSALKTREPVSTKIWDAFLVSAPLMLMAQFLIYVIAVPLGVICAVDRGGWWDRLISLKLFLLYSIPPYVAGMLLLVFLCYGDYLKLFPMMNLHSDNYEDLGFFANLVDYFWHAALPVLCLSLFSLASMAMYSRSAMLDVIKQDYIRTARAKGLSASRVIGKHALRNGLIPIITLFASFLPAMLGGSVLIESIFGIPGMGRMSLHSITNQDYPTLMALIYVDAIIVMLSILLADFLYVIADPRISFEGQGATK
jgi:ABC-type dipeptide/oligopeptide/nickel transport system permease component